MKLNGPKKSMQSLQKAEPSSTLCSHCKPEKVVRLVAKTACNTQQPTSNSSRGTIATQVGKELAQCNTSRRAQINF